MYQFGFRNHLPTNHHALISIREKIQKPLDDGKFAYGVFLVLWHSKPQDTSKLEHYGIRGISLNLFLNYLKNWTQFVKRNRKSSAVLPIGYGILQGSVLGPFLFLRYINDLNDAVVFSKIHHFADI